MRRSIASAEPNADGKDSIERLSPNKFQFGRHGYFVADRVDHSASKLVFNLALRLKDGWGK